jgi:hypothetical protein
MNYQIETDPLPKDDIFCHDVRLHLAFHLDVEDLESLLSLQRDHLRGRVHDGRVGRDGAADGVGGVGHIDDDHLVGLAHFFADTDELVRLHGEAVKADIGSADADIGELAEERGEKKNALVIVVQMTQIRVPKWG